MRWLEIRNQLYKKYQSAIKKGRTIHFNLKVFRIQYRGDGEFFYSCPFKKHIKTGIFKINISWLQKINSSYFQLFRDQIQTLIRKYPRKKTPKKYYSNRLSFKKKFVTVVSSIKDDIKTFSRAHSTWVFAGSLVMLLFFMFDFTDLEEELEEINAIGGFSDLHLNEKPPAALRHINSEAFEKDEKLKDNLLGISGNGSTKKKSLKKISYKVQPGDTLSHISKKFKISVESIAGSSGIKSPDSILIGQTLKIPSKEGFYYKVKKGDRLSGLLSKYKIKLEKILSENPVINPDLLEEGEEIFLLGAKPKNLLRQWLFPVYSRVMTSGYGWRKWPRQAFHKGIDLKAYYISVKAARSGRVTYAGRLGGYGKVVVIAHAGFYKTLYAHLSRIYVRSGMNVGQGRVIGKSGNTGYSFGPHLHFEVSHRGRNINPRRILKGLRQKRR